MSGPAREIHPYLLQNEFSLDDVVFSVPKIPRFEPYEVDYSIQVTERTELKRPIIGSPMDTVTEAEMAILLARMGGIGVIHVGMPIDEQVAQVERVRHWEAGFVFNPAVLSPTATVKDILAGERSLGFSSYPITQDGTLETPILGIVTKRDVQDFRDGNHQMIPVNQVMTPMDNLIYANKEDTIDKNDLKAANALIRAKGLDTLPILDKEGKVVALVTRSDIEKDDKYPLATKDGNKQLKVWAAVDSRFNTAKDRIVALAAADVSGIVIDSRNIYGDYLNIAKFAKKQNPEMDVIVGNLVHPAVLEEVLGEGHEYVDAFRVGIGTGEVCVTTEGLGIGAPMGKTLLILDQAYREMGGDKKFGRKGFMSDGGNKFPRHFIAGAMLHRNFAGVMIGTAIAGFDESPAKQIQKAPGVYVKRVRGMGSIGAILERAGGNRYRVDQIDRREIYAEGIEKDVPSIGPGEPHITEFFGGVQAAMHAIGSRNIQELYENAVINPVARAASKGTL